MVATEVENLMPTSTMSQASTSDHPSSPQNPNIANNKKMDATLLVPDTPTTTNWQEDNTYKVLLGTDDGSCNDESHVSESGGKAPTGIADTDGQHNHNNMDKSPADKKLISIYSNTIHQNCVLHLSNNIPSDKEW